MSSVDKSVKEVQDIMQDNLRKILKRGEDLHMLSQKVEDLSGAAALFKKRAKEIKRKVETQILPTRELPKLPQKDEMTPIKRVKSLDYLTEIEDTQMSEYEQQLMEYYHEGHYQYVLDKASQLGLLRFVKHVLELSTFYPLELNIADSLKAASYYGHVEIVEELLEHDINNERYYGKAPREEIISILPFFDDKPRIPYTNEPLTHDDLRNSIINAHTANHSELAKILENYYYRTHAIKDRHDTAKADKFLAKLI
jgi:hypothetical protein